MNNMLVCSVSRSVCVMTTQAISKLLKSRDASVAVDFKSWPPVLETGESVREMTSLFRVMPVRCSSNVRVYLLDDLPKRRCALLYKPCDPDSLAYLDFSVSTTGMLAGVKV